MATIRTMTASTMAIGTGISITGYTDKTGTAENNLELAKQRALAVRTALVQLGVQPARITMQPPVAVTGSGSDGQARRVDIRVGP
jgi:outer membrane protein OmpA-like peptidoglycan-associated protein